MDLAGKTVIVTGASRGIGAATAHELARRGAIPLLVARTAEKLEAVKSEIEAAGGKAAAYAVDLGDPDAVLEIADRTHSEFGTPDVIVNNAGAGRWLSVEETPMKEAVDMMGAPYFAAFFVTRAFLPKMIERGSGWIANVNSPASLIPIPGAAGYSAARAALRTLSHALSLELRGTGVGVTHFTAGKVESTYFDHNEGEDRIPSIASIIRTLTPEETAGLLVDAIARERSEVVVPLMLKSFYALYQVAPWLVTRTMWATSWRRLD